jgi:hypothetical protein
LVENELEQLSSQVAATGVLPFDKHGHEGKEIALERLSKQSRLRYLQIAAVLADMFSRRGIDRPDPTEIGVHSRSG